MDERYFITVSKAVYDAGKQLEALANERSDGLQDWNLAEMLRDVHQDAGLIDDAMFWNDVYLFLRELDVSNHETLVKIECGNRGEQVQ